MRVRWSAAVNVVGHHQPFCFFCFLCIIFRFSGSSFRGGEVVVFSRWRFCGVSTSVEASLQGYLCCSSMEAYVYTILLFRNSYSDSICLRWRLLSFLGFALTPLLKESIFAHSKVGPINRLEQSILIARKKWCWIDLGCFKWRFRWIGIFFNWRWSDKNRLLKWLRILSFNIRWWWKFPWRWWFRRKSKGRGSS